MLPALARNQYLMVSRLSYHTTRPLRGDVVVFRYPNQQGKEYIKRIVGLPGEHIRIEGERVFINGTLLKEPYVDAKDHCDDAYDKEWPLDDAEYFVIGDNRSDSQDSRSFGPIDQKLIIGRVWIRYWPPSAWGIIRHQEVAGTGRSSGA